MYVLLMTNAPLERAIIKRAVAQNLPLATAREAGRIATTIIYEMRHTGRSARDVVARVSASTWRELLRNERVLIKAGW